MFHYLKYCLKVMFGFMIITALDAILKKEGVFIGNLWFIITLIIYIGYCYVEYNLTDKQD